MDLADYNALATNFDPSGAYGPYLWQDGNSDGDCGQSGKQFPARCLLESIRVYPGIGIHVNRDIGESCSFTTRSLSQRSARCPITGEPITL